MVKLRRQHTVLALKKVEALNLNIQSSVSYTARTWF